MALSARQDGQTHTMDALQLGRLAASQHQEQSMATSKKGADIEVGDYLHGEDGRVDAVWEADDEWMLTELDDGRTRAVGQDEDVTVSTKEDQA